MSFKIGNAMPPLNDDQATHCWTVADASFNPKGLITVYTEQKYKQVCLRLPTISKILKVDRSLNIKLKLKVLPNNSAENTYSKEFN